MVPYYLPRISGSLCFPLAVLLPILLGRTELFAPLLLGGAGLVSLSLVWRLKMEGDPVFAKARKYFDPAIKILEASIIVNFCTGVVGSLLHTGFSPQYAAAVFAGLALLLAGSSLSAGASFFEQDKS